MSAFDQQYGGNHYKDMMIQPLEYALANNLGVCEHAVVKYISRWRAKGGVEDLRKARHYIEILIERETIPQAEDQTYPVPRNTIPIDAIVIHVQP